MMLLDDWRAVLRRAWSIRLLSVALLLLLVDIAAVVLETMGLIADRPGVSIALRALSAIFTSAAFVARLMMQRSMK